MFRPFTVSDYSDLVQALVSQVFSTATQILVTGVARIEHHKLPGERTELKSPLYREDLWPAANDDFHPMDISREIIFLRFATIERIPCEQLLDCRN